MTLSVDPELGQKQARLRIASFACGAVLACAVLLVPAVTAVVATSVLAGQMLLSGVCNAHLFVRKPRQPEVVPLPESDSETAGPAFLSVHVPAHNEPPALLIATLSCLRQQVTTAAHEVLVIVNNTADPALWRPVRNWCDAAGQPFRFLRCDGLRGAKAGALNLALAATCPAATHIVVVDADYQVVPEFLRSVADQIARTGADFIQFPQAYRHLSPSTEGLSFELADYFNRHARSANAAQAMLLTGTLSVIRRDALEAVGCWPTQSGTEDAALGSRLIAAGYSGVFIDAVVGRGLMPLDMHGLHQQRQRWAAGNAQVLVETLKRFAVSGPSTSATLQKVLVASQLAAWLNLGAMAGATLLVSLFQVSAGLALPTDSAVNVSLGLSVLTLALIVLAAALPLAWSQRGTVGPSVRLQAILSRVAMLPVSARATLAGMAQRPQVFRVTPKQLPTTVRTVRSSALTGSGLVSAVMISWGVALDVVWPWIAGLILLAPMISAPLSQRALQRYSATVAAKES